MTGSAGSSAILCTGESHQGYQCGNVNSYSTLTASIFQTYRLQYALGPTPPFWQRWVWRCCTLTRHNLRESWDSPGIRFDLKTAFKATLSCGDLQPADERESGRKSATPADSLVRRRKHARFTFGLRGAVISGVSDVPCLSPCISKYQRSKGKWDLPGCVISKLDCFDTICMYEMLTAAPAAPRANQTLSCFWPFLSPV